MMMMTTIIDYDDDDDNDDDDVQKKLNANVQNFSSYPLKLMMKNCTAKPIKFMKIILTIEKKITKK